MNDEWRATAFRLQFGFSPPRNDRLAPNANSRPPRAGQQSFRFGHHVRGCGCSSTVPGIGQHFVQCIPIPVEVKRSRSRINRPPSTRSRALFASVSATASCNRHASGERRRSPSIPSATVPPAGAGQSKCRAARRARFLQGMNHAPLNSSGDQANCQIGCSLGGGDCLGKYE